MTDGMVGLEHNELQPARVALRKIQQYEHPLSRCGLRQGPAMTAMQLKRVLDSHAENYTEQYNAEVDRFGERTSPDDPKTAKVAKDSPHRMAFNAAIAELGKVVVEVPAKLRLKLSDLKVRDENGELVDMEIGSIGDLGPLLIVEEEAAPGTPKSKEVKRRRPAE